MRIENNVKGHFVKKPRNLKQRQFVFTSPNVDAANE